MFFLEHTRDRLKPQRLAEHEFIGITPEDISYVRLKKIDTSKVVILQTATFRTKKDFNAHRLLRAIDNNILLSKLHESEQGKSIHKMLPVKELYALYEEFPEVIENTKSVLDQCSIDFDFSKDAVHQNQKTYTGSHEEDEKLLKQLCNKGLFYRYPDTTQEVFDRVEMELATIQLASIFLENQSSRQS